MLTQDGWFDWARREPGPADKVYTEENRAEGIVIHSAVGFYGGWLSRLFSTERLPDGRYTDYAAASVHGFVLTTGRLIQHYPLWGPGSSCWASGNRHANTRFDAFETEGGYPVHTEPLTDEQYYAYELIVSDIAEARGWVPARAGPNGTMHEHNECVTYWGGAPTDCPSDRVDWDRLLAMLNEGDSDMLMIVREEGSRYLWLSNGVMRSYLRSKDHSDALGIPWVVKVVPRGTLDSVARLDDLT